ncbi:protein Iojap-related, mitochondrial-like [Bidens hawaiensis]|uniref:protein Iojap-related, mitochondrial-like n=1 Tax=Bidens hawaiensis TaxID=980011 RepID=UPI004049E7F1
MWPSVRNRALSDAVRQFKSRVLLNRSVCSSGELLKLEEVEKILSDVRADDVRVIPVNNNNNNNNNNESSFTNFVVVATGKSQWHVRNIAQALIYKVKQKQTGAKRMLLPSVEGEEGGNWIVIDSGSLVVHALDEKARAYYNLEQLWSSKESTSDKSQSQTQDLGQAFVKVRRKNNSKKPAK